MNYAKPLLGLILTGLIATGCAGTATKTVSVEDYTKAMSDAKAAIQKARSVNYEWRDSGKILKKAAKLAKAGNYAKALKLALKAKQQGELAYAQSIDQKDAGPRL